MKTVAFDESENFGSNFLHERQPTFAYASTCFEQEEIATLLKKFKKQSIEYKFTLLKKRKDNLSCFEELLNCETLIDDKVKIQVINKEYELIAQYIDKIVEPVLYYELDIDIFRHQANIGYVNILYCMLQHMSQEKKMLF